MIVVSLCSVKNLNTTLPLLKDKITHVETLSVKGPPGGNMTESIRRIKDVIEETRNFVNRVKYLTCCFLTASFDLKLL